MGDKQFMRDAIPYTLPVTPPAHVDQVWARVIQTIWLAVAFVLACTLLGGVAAVAWGDLNALRVGVIVGVVLASLVLILVAGRDLWDALERQTGRDLDGDGDVGGERIILLNANKQAAETDEEREEREFRNFVALCATDTTTRTHYPMGRAKYEAWRNILIQGGFARWDDARLKTTWSLTTTPESACAAILNGRSARRSRSATLHQAGRG